jgi:hypothetical protein
VLQHWPNFPPKSRDDSHHHRRPRSLVWAILSGMAALGVTVGVATIMIHDRIQ